MSATAYQLVLQKSLAATPDRVFAALIDPSKLQRWMAPGAMDVAEAHCNPVVGGHYRIVMRNADGSHVATSGVYQEVVPNRRLVHTWQWDGSEEVTLVTIELKPEGAGGTNLQLTHSRFAEQSTCDQHEQGWTSCLEKLLGLAD